jgi:hypothetical protein
VSCYYCEGEPTCRTCADLDERMGEEDGTQVACACGGPHYCEAEVKRLRAEVQFQRDWCRDNLGLMPPSVEQNAAFMRALDERAGQ